MTALALLGAASAFGQDVQGSATMTATAELTTPITVTPGDNIELGTIIQGTSKHVDALTKSVDAAAATTTGSKDGLTGGEQRGYVNLSGGPGDGLFSVEVTVPNQLTGVGNADNSLPVRFDDNPGSAQKLGFNGALVEAFPGTIDDLTASASNFTKYLPQGGDASINDAWKANNFFDSDTGTGGVTYFLENDSKFDIRTATYLVLGAMVEAGADQPVDTYQGSVTITFTLEN